jgi:hypothetical protein
VDTGRATIQPVTQYAEAPAPVVTTAAPVPAPAAVAPAAASAPASFDTVPSTAPHARSADEWDQIRACWSANSAADPYRVYQQMSEHGWDDADVAYATGQSVQAVGDYLTRIGAEAGFGGSATVGRGIDDAYMTALQSSGVLPPTVVQIHAVVDESGQAVYDESGQQVVQSTVDLVAFTQWYVSQGTDAARAFARIHGSFSSDGAGGVQFASGARLMQTYDESGAATGPSFAWAMDSRISAYQGYAKGNLLEQAAMAINLQTPLNDQILQTFGNPNRQLPNNELGERMRALYGTEAATYMLNLQDAVAAMKARYMGDLNAAMAQATSPAALGINTAVHIDESGNAVYYDESGQAQQVPISFDAAAFQQRYATQGPEQKLITEAIGAGVMNAGEGGFTTAGALDQLNIAFSHDENGALQAADVTLQNQDLTTINIASPPDLYNTAAVWFMPMAGFVTSTQNLKPEDDWTDIFEQIVPVLVSFVAGPLAGAVVSGLINDNLSLKGILQSVLPDILSAGLTSGLEAVVGPIANGTALGIVENMAVKGTTQALMGGSFTDGALGALASGISGSICGLMNADIARAVQAGTMSSVEASAAHYFSSMMGAAMKMAAMGSSRPGYDLARAFLDEAMGQLGSSGAVPQAPGPFAAAPAPADGPVGDAAGQGAPSNANIEAPAPSPVAQAPAPVDAAPAPQPVSPIAQAPAPASSLPNLGGPAPQLFPNLALSGSPWNVGGDPGSSGDDSWEADVAARRAADGAQQRNALWSSVGSSGVQIDTTPHSVYVQPGDSLTAIAARWAGAGATTDDINNLKNLLIAANPQLRDPNQLSIGQELRFPDSSTVYDAAARSRATGADSDYQAQLADRRQAYWDSLQQGAWSGRTGTGGPIWHVGGGASTSTTNSGSGGPLSDEQLSNSLGLVPSSSNGDGLPWRIGVGGRVEPNYAYAGPDAPMVPMVAPPGPQSHWGTRVAGLIDAAGGVVEMTTGGALFVTGGATSELGVGIPLMAGGTLLALGGADHVQSGWQTFWYGENHPTLLNTGLQQFGFSPRAAGYIDLGLNGFGTIAAGGWLQSLNSIPAYAPAVGGAVTDGAVAADLGSVAADRPLLPSRPTGINDWPAGGTTSSGRPITAATGEGGAANVPARLEPEPVEYTGNQQRANGTNGSNTAEGLSEPPAPPPAPNDASTSGPSGPSLGNASRPTEAPSLQEIASRIPSSLTRSDLGSEIGFGAEKTVYTLGDNNALVIAVRNDGVQLLADQEIAALNRVGSADIPVVKNFGTITVDGKAAIVLENIPGVSSRDIYIEGLTGVPGGGVIVGNARAESVLNSQSIADLQNIRSQLIAKDIGITDLQFMIRNDGRVFVNDPMAVTDSVKPSNLQLIDTLIAIAKGQH